MQTFLLSVAASSILWNNTPTPTSSFSLSSPKAKKVTFFQNQKKVVLFSTFIEFVDDDDDDNVDEEDYMLQALQNSPWRVTADMKYTEYNVNRQRNNYRAIRSVGGIETGNDIYAREPGCETFWFVGKVAHCTGTVSLNQVISQQWNLIEQHAVRLRNLELGRKFGTLEIWTAPPDSEMDVVYNRPNIKFENMIRDHVDPTLRSVEIGFEGECYVNDEEGFRTLRTEDGLPLKPEITGINTTGVNDSSSSEEDRRADDGEMDDTMKMLNDGVTKQQKMEE